MQERFKLQDTKDIIYYLQCKKKININPFDYITFSIHNGRLDYIVVVDFNIVDSSGSKYSCPYIIDLYDYYNFFRKLKIINLKTQKIC